MKPVIGLSILLAASGSVMGQSPQQKGGSSGANLFGSHNSNAPINVSADSFVGDLASKVGTYIGNVIVVQGDMKLRADTVQVKVEQGKASRIDANGKVVVTSPSGTGTGDHGVYEMKSRTITMTGRVVLTKDKDVMRGTKLVMDMNTNLAHLYAQGMPGGRVQGLFVPPPQGAGATKKKSGAKPARVNDTIVPDSTTPSEPPK
ncbi:MAG: lipopolysaccharide transport periplasmic protein LptA [Alphaproteobacteria bacterium]|nr:lipopolysaccharide transport periplasmic protein LptA [Alphaproteobacteria bacterium]